LNEGKKRDQPPEQVDLRDDGVEIDLPNREEIESTLKYLKNNKIHFQPSCRKMVTPSWWIH
jgi:hypothetical protein